MTSLRLRPTELTAVAEGAWSSRVLGFSVVAPPTVLDVSSDAEDVRRARLALETGLASAEFSGRNLCTRFVLGLRVPVTTAEHLPRGAWRAVFRCAQLMLVRQLPIWLMLVAWCSGAVVAGDATAVTLSVAVAAFLLSFVVHESGHIAAMRLLDRTSPGVLVVGRCTAHLVRGRGSRRHDLVITLAGPVAPLIAAMPSVALMAQAPVLVACLLAIGVGHLFHLVTAGGDGHALRDAWRGHAS